MGEAGRPQRFHVVLAERENADVAGRLGRNRRSVGLGVDVPDHEGNAVGLASLGDFRLEIDGDHAL